MRESDGEQGLHLPDSWKKLCGAAQQLENNFELQL